MAQDYRSAAMSAGLARNWWTVGLRALFAVVFIIAVLLLPRPTLGALIIMFAAYVAADGALAIVLGLRAMRRGELWQTLIFEAGAVGLGSSVAFSDTNLYRSRCAESSSYVRL